MTGQEKETLTLLLDQLREFRQETREDAKEMKDTIHGIDTRVRAMEMKDLTAVTVATTTAAIASANNAKAERRAIGMGRLFAIVAAAAGTGASIAVMLHTLGLF